MEARIIDISFDNLFNIFHKETKCNLHSLKPLFYCTNASCSNDYLCSNCLSENDDHYTQHGNMFIPIDTKDKFLKHLNISLNTETNENVNALISPTKESIEQFYEVLKKKMIQVIDQHQQSNIDKLLFNINLNNTEASNDEVYKAIDEKIQGFSSKKDISIFAKKLNDDLKKIQYHTKQGEQTFDEHFNKKANELINDSASNYFGLKSKENSNNSNSYLNQIKGEFDIISSSIPEPSNNESIKNRLQLLKDKMNQIKK